MIEFLGLYKSDKPDKKFYAEFKTDTGRTKRTYFGSAYHGDFTKFSAMEREERKRRYLSRHKEREDWNDPTSAGALSRWILWNKPSISASLKDYKKRFNL